MEAASAAAPGPTGTRRIATWQWVVLAAVVAASFALRWYRIDDALTGYHVVNEGFYTELGSRYLEGGLFAPFTQPLDANNPPLYAFLVRLLFSIVGPSLSAARAISVFASTATIIAIFLLDRELYKDASGLVAATIYGLSPGSVLVGGNAQVEALLVLLRVLAILAYVHAARTKDVRFSALSGFLLGLAVLTKLPALVVLVGLAIWETWGVKGFSWLRRRRTKWFSVAFIATAVPWFLAQLAFNPAWRRGQGGLLSTIELPGLQTLSIWFGSELFWLVSPIVFVALLFAVVRLSFRREPSDVLVLSLLGVNFAFYLFFSYHTYYLLPAVPMVAIAVAAFVRTLGVRGKARVITVVTVLAIVLFVSAAVMVGGKKWGGWYGSDVREVVMRSGYPPEAIVLAVDREVLESWEPPLHAAFPDTPLVAYPVESAALMKYKRPVLYLQWHEDRQSASDPATVWQKRHTPVFFGHTVHMPATIAVHHFGIVEAEVVRVGPWWWFGIDESSGPTRLQVEVLRP